MSLRDLPAHSQGDPSRLAPAARGAYLMRPPVSLPLLRREFLQVSTTAAGGLAVSLFWPRTGAVAESMRPKLPPAANQPLGSFVRIEPDGRIVIGARGCEIGQGVRTSLPMLIAEELDVAWENVRVEQLPFGIQAGAQPGSFVGRYGPQGAGGSTSVSDGWDDLRQAGAQIRALLIATAARHWRADASSLTTHAGEVLHADGRRLSYGTLAPHAATQALPAGPFKLKEPKDFRIIGRPTRVADCGDIVSGRARYGSDASVPGMLFA